MSGTIECSTHGETRAVYVYQHLVRTLHDEESRGAFWSRDEDGCINACCGDCAKRLDAAGGEWVGEAEAQLGLQIVCEGCFRQVAMINGFSELD
jgi:hypothetical protein